MEQPESTGPGFAILLGPRQITAVLVVAISVAGILCSLTYIAGRSASHAPSVPSPVPARAAAPPPKPLILKSEPCPSTPAQSPQPAGISVWQNAPPLPGATAIYLQVASVPPGTAEVFAEGLHSEGFDAVTAPGASTAVQRVLVGPLKDEAIASVLARLEARGFHPFLKRYPESGAPAEPPKTDNQ
jgi:hypothetical protein